MEYKASPDPLVKIITAGVFLLFLFIGYQSVSAILKSQNSTTELLIHSSIIIFLIAVLLVSWIYAPKSYNVDDNQLAINRPIGKVTLKLSDIAEVRVPEKSEIKGVIRTFGVGGLFGYFGKFHISGIGHVTMYATQMKNYILIITRNNKRIIITPDDIVMANELIKRMK